MHRFWFLPLFAMPFLLVLLWLGVVALIFGFWIWMLIDAATHEPSQGNDKIVWVVVILLTHIIGALLYFFIRRPTRIRTCGH
jgi:hypothetical protein